ncbi:MAG: hypothetical protein K8H86_09720, partial [Ignavibacteriaceae bacterium]|nr:hypothetical protein [Ignavibacteriaceae bacterium]
QITCTPTSLTAYCPAITVSNSGVIYAGDNVGNFYTSTDKGDNWSVSYIGDPQSIADMAISSSGNIFVTTSGNGVYKSTDGGLTWQTNPMILGFETRDIKIKGNTLFVSTKDYGLGKSTDEGVTWESASSTVPESNIGAFNISNNGTLLIGVKGLNGLYRSVDNGASWTLTNFPQSYRVYSLTVGSDNSIFAATAEYINGVYKSTDDGISWAKISGLPDNIEYYTNGFALSDGSIFLGVYGTGIYMSTDYGTNWTLENNGLQSMAGYIFAKGTDGTIYATTGSGIYKSTHATGIKNNNQSVINFNLEQNFPNPFNPSTTINYTVSQPGVVKLIVYDILGREVEIL